MIRDNKHSGDNKEIVEWIKDKTNRMIPKSCVKEWCKKFDRITIVCHINEHDVLCSLALSLDKPKKIIRFFYMYFKSESIRIVVDSAKIAGFSIQDIFGMIPADYKINEIMINK